MFLDIITETIVNALLLLKKLIYLDMNGFKKKCGMPASRKSDLNGYSDPTNIKQKM